MQLILFLIGAYVVYALFFYRDGSEGSYSDSAGSSDKIYSDGTRRYENISGTGFTYTDGGVREIGTSYVDILGNEHRSNGEVVIENTLTGQRDIYRDNELVGHEYDDVLGITHRY